MGFEMKDPDPIEMEDGTQVTPTGDGYDLVYPDGETDRVDFPTDDEE